MCYNTTDIKFLYDDFYFNFTDRIKDSNFQGTQILHIHYYTKDISFINYKIDVDRIIINSNEIDLKIQLKSSQKTLFSLSETLEITADMEEKNF